MAPNKSNKANKGGSTSSGKSGPSTSRNREESMGESGEDEFARKGAVRNPDQAARSGRGKGAADTHQRSRESGTAGLGGETSGSDSIRGPGGVEGTGGAE
jgi:hypothetical protein